jgi:hypothetical protein
LVAVQIILLSQWSNKKNSIKRPIKKAKSKWLGPHRFVQNDILVKLDMGAKSPQGGSFGPKFLVKKPGISCCVIYIATRFNITVQSDGWMVKVLDCD